MKLHVAIALGLLGGLLLGLLAAASGSPSLLWFAQGTEPIGRAFVNLLRMVVFPLVAATLFVGVAGLGDTRRLGRLGVLTLFFFWSTTVVAILIGMGTMRILLPLAGDAARTAAAGTAMGEVPKLPGAVDFLLSLIPGNPIRAAADDALLPFIVFTILFAAAAGALPKRENDYLIDLANAVAGALIKLVHWILWLAPVGVFALAAPVTAKSGWAMLQSLAAFVLAVILGLLAFIVLIYLPLVRVLGRVSPFRFLKAALGPQLIAFSTTSSAATIPAMLEAAEEELTLSRTVSSLVIPLGAALNRSGSALFQGAGIVFLAWLYQVPLPLAALSGALLATFLVSLTVASVPSASVLTLAPALGQLGIPIDGLAVLLGIDRIPDMFRTATNVTGDMAAAIAMERETDTTTDTSARRPRETQQRALFTEE